MFNQVRFVLAFAVLTQCCGEGRADIYRWDSGAVIPGTEGIDAGPGVQLDNRDLTYAALAQTNLEGASFEASNLSNAVMGSGILSNANLSGAIVNGTSLDFAVCFTVFLPNPEIGPGSAILLFDRAIRSDCV